MNRSDPRDALAALTEQSEAGVPLTAFAVSFNLPAVRMDAIVESLSLQRVENQSENWVFSATRWQGLLDRIEQAVEDLHETRPELAGASLKDIQLALKPHVETPVLEAAIDALTNESRLGRRGARFHSPSHEIQVSEHDRQLWTQASVLLAPQSGSPISLHQAAAALKVERKVLKTSLKNAVKYGEMVSVAKNRYMPTSYIAKLGSAAETLAGKTDDGYFTAAEYCEQTQTGRNFAIDLLEYFDRLGFTERSGNNRRIRRPAASIFAVDDAGS